MRNTTIAVLAALVAAAAPSLRKPKPTCGWCRQMAPQGKYVGPLCPLKGGDFHTSQRRRLSQRRLREGYRDQGGAGAVGTVDGRSMPTWSTRR